MPSSPLCTAGHWPSSDPFAPLSVKDADPQCTDAIVPTKKGDLRTKKQIQTSLIHFQFFVCRKLFSWYSSVERNVGRFTLYWNRRRCLWGNGINWIKSRPRDKKFREFPDKFVKMATLEVRGEGLKTTLVKIDRKHCIWEFSATLLFSKIT